MLKASGAMADALPVDASCEDIEVDESLSMLDGFVQAALANGAAPYTPPVRTVRVFINNSIAAELKGFRLFFMADY